MYRPPAARSRAPVPAAVPGSRTGDDAPDPQRSRRRGLPSRNGSLRTPITLPAGGVSPARAVFRGAPPGGAAELRDTASPPRTRGLPNRVQAFKFSTDPEPGAKIRDVVSLYLAPADTACGVSVDEKSQIQALGRTAPMLPLRLWAPGRRTRDYSATAPPPCSPPRSQNQAIEELAPRGLAEVPEEQGFQMFARDKIAEAGGPGLGWLTGFRLHLHGPDHPHRFLSRVLIASRLIS